MTTDNVIDLDLYRAEQLSTCKRPKPISPELETAIQDLIYQLRERGPLSKAGAGE